MVDEARAGEYEIFARTVSLPMFRSQQGYVGVIMARQEKTCVVMSFWESNDDINRLDMSATYKDTVGQILSMGFLHGEQTTEIFDVHLLDFSRSV
jgi:heme-degrading monooxygenase HmoA